MSTASKIEEKKPAITKEIATEEVNGWLDYKRVRPSKRQEKEDHVQGMIECVEDGIFVINEDFTITFNVLWPEEIGNIKTLTFKPRISDREIDNYYKRLDKKSTTSFILARKAALTGINTTILMNMDTEDSTIADHITAFFL